MDALFTLPNLVSLLTLTLLEIVLGIDNIIFISIIAAKLPADQQPKARVIGISLALITRLIMLSMISWLASMNTPLTTIAGFELSGRDIILLIGGLFLFIKTAQEIRHKLNEAGDGPTVKQGTITFNQVIVQIILIDIVFSFDSILTAVGLSNQLVIMVLAVIISMVVMLIFAGKVSSFISNRPTVKMLALAFLLLIGAMLVLEGLHIHIEKGYIYFAMAFSFIVDYLNRTMLKRASRRKKEQQLKKVD